MRYILFTFYICFFTYMSPVSSQTWQITESPTHQNLARLDMVSPTSGWAVSYDGLILKYDGQNWKISNSLQQIEKKITTHSDSLHADISDWGDIYTIRMIDSTHGWIAVNHHKKGLYRLLEFNGSIWKPYPHLFPLKLRSLDFLNNSFGITVGEGGGFQYLNNQWSIILQLPISLDFIAAKVISPNNLFIVGENGAILEKKTKWSVLVSPSSETIRDMDFISQEEGWFVGKNGTILHYKNGTLIPEKAETSLDLWAIDMVNSNLGFIVGKQGIILQYNGTTWERHDMPIQADLHDIEMLDENDGWIVGGQGVIIKYGVAPPSKAPQQAHRFLFMDQVFLGTSHLMDLIDDVMGVTTADFNGDNLSDIYLTCFRSLNHLLLNQGQGYYVDFTIESGAGGDLESRKGMYKVETGSLAADFDRDGDTDILLAGKRGTTRLLINNGKAIFEDKTKQANFPENLNVTAGTIADFNEDGYPDVVLADEFTGLRLWMNQKYYRFQEQSLNSLSLPLTGIRAIAAADFNDDFHTDILIFFHQHTPTLLLNNNDSGWQENMKMFSQVAVSNFVNSATVADFNNDGHNDLFLCTENGEDAILFFQPANKLFLDRSKEWGIKRNGRSYSASAGDFDLDGDLDLYVSRFGPDYFYINENFQTFSEQASKAVASKAGYLSGYNTGTATTDIDKDGDLDLIVGNLEYWSSLLENTKNDSNYIILDLKGTEDTYEALGAKIWIWPADTLKTSETLFTFREINPGGGFFSQNWNAVHIGLGEIDQVNIKVRFLNGDIMVFDKIGKGRTLTIHQSTRMFRAAYSTCRACLQFLHRPYIFREILKFLFFVLMIFFSVRFIEQRYHWRPTYIFIYIFVALMIYGLLTLLLPRYGGVLFHTLPFGMILFALLILISVNEQIRKSTQRRNLVQKKLQETTANLSRTTITDKAINLIVKTLQVVQPYNFLVLYLYHSNGNYFLCKKNEGIRIGKSKRQVILRREKIHRLIREKSPLSFSKFKNIWPTQKYFNEKTILFPLVFKKEMYGVIIMQPESDLLEETPISTMNYLFLQLTATLHNISMIQDLKDKEKLAAIGTFSSGIIHELKNPIDGLRMMIEVLFHETQPNDSRYEFIKELQQGIIKLKETLIHSFDIINYEDRVTERVALNDLIRSIDSYFSKLNFPPLQLQFDSKIDTVKGNDTQLKLALENIIQNAMEASDYAKTVIVRTQLSQRDETVQINITDNGYGISVENLDKIFDMFYSTRGTHRGLGLTITRNIIKNHGGYIDVNSAIGKGTQFTVVLPVI